MELDNIAKISFFAVTQRLFRYLPFWLTPGMIEVNSASHLQNSKMLPCAVVVGMDIQDR